MRAPLLLDLAELTAHKQNVLSGEPVRSIVLSVFHLSEKIVRWCIESTRCRSPEGEFFLN